MNLISFSFTYNSDTQSFKIELDHPLYRYLKEIKNIFTFLLSGRRINEVLQLKCSDINLEEKTFKVPASTAKGKKELVFNL